MSLHASSPYRLSSRERWADPSSSKVRSFRLARSEPEDDHLHERVSLARGWYDVPDRPGRQRFWDGHRFVAARPTPSEEQPARPEAARDEPARRSTPALAVSGVVCGVLAALLAMFVASGLVAVWWVAGAAALGAASFAILGNTAQAPAPPA